MAAKAQHRRMRAIIISSACLFALAGCETPPPPPYMVALNNQCQSGSTQACMALAQANAPRPVNISGPIAQPIAMPPPMRGGSAPPRQTWCRPDGYGGMYCG